MGLVQKNSCQDEEYGRFTEEIRQGTLDDSHDLKVLYTL